VTGLTNHALDQFLEHLLHAGIKKIVRLGSRSKSEEIQPFALEEQCRNRGKTAEQRLAIVGIYVIIEFIHITYFAFIKTHVSRGLQGIRSFVRPSRKVGETIVPKDNNVGCKYFLLHMTIVHVLDMHYMESN